MSTKQQSELERGLLTGKSVSFAPEEGGKKATTEAEKKRAASTFADIGEVPPAPKTVAERFPGEAPPRRVTAEQHPGEVSPPTKAIAESMRAAVRRIRGEQYPGEVPPGGGAGKAPLKGPKLGPPIETPSEKAARLTYRKAQEPKVTPSERVALLKRETEEEKGFLTKRTLSILGKVEQKRQAESKLYTPTGATAMVTAPPKGVQSKDYTEGIEQLKRIAKSFVPGWLTKDDWDRMSTLEKAASIAGDVGQTILYIVGVGAAAKAFYVRGTAKYSVGTVPKKIPGLRTISKREAKDILKQLLAQNKNRLTKSQIAGLKEAMKSKPFPLAEYRLPKGKFWIVNEGPTGKVYARVGESHVYRGPRATPPGTPIKGGRPLAPPKVLKGGARPAPPSTSTMTLEQYLKYAGIRTVTPPAPIPIKPYLPEKGKPGRRVLPGVPVRPAPSPAPTPEPTTPSKPSPKPPSTPKPTKTPEPGPYKEPEPAPSGEPSAAPSPAPSPAPAPAPSPKPSPTPTPTPTPSPAPAPAPAPAPSPAPSPAPAKAGELPPPGLPRPIIRHFIRWPEDDATQEEKRKFVKEHPAIGVYNMGKLTIKGKKQDIWWIMYPNNKRVVIYGQAPQGVKILASGPGSAKKTAQAIGGKLQRTFVQRHGAVVATLKPSSIPKGAEISFRPTGLGPSRKVGRIYHTKTSGGSVLLSRRPLGRRH